MKRDPIEARISTMQINQLGCRGTKLVLINLLKTVQHVSHVCRQNRTPAHQLTCKFIKTANADKSVLQSCPQRKISPVQIAVVIATERHFVWWATEGKQCWEVVGFNIITLLAYIYKSGHAEYMHIPTIPTPSLPKLEEAQCVFNCKNRLWDQLWRCLPVDGEVCCFTVCK